jgi:predicted PurR-regulated permease PerM
MPASERLRRVGIAAWSLIGIFIVIAGLVWALLKIRIIFPPLVLAVLIIYLLNPVVSWLERKRVPRVIGAIGSYVVVFGILTLVAIAVFPLVSRQVSEVGDHWPEYRADILVFVEDTASGLERTFDTDIDTAQVGCLLGAEASVSGDEITQSKCAEVTSDLRETVLAQADRITDLGTSVLHTLLVFILAPLIALYLLIDLPHVRRDLMNLVPESHRTEITDLTSKVGMAVGGFFRGQLLVAFLVGTLSAIGFYIIGLPFWFLIGAIAGFFNLIPLVGPYIGGALGFLVGTISSGVGLGLKAALVELIVQQIDNHILSPNIMKRTVNVHPVTVMLALLAGGALAGFWGVLLGVPAVAVGKLLLGHVWATRVLGSPPTPRAKSEGGPGPEQEAEPAAGFAEPRPPPPASGHEPEPPLSPEASPRADPG